MNAEEIINAIQSTDPHEVWLASWELIRMKNSDGIQTIAEVLLPISDSLTPFPVPKGTHVRDYRYAPKLALKILACHAADKCRCSIYESSDCLDPQKEQELGNINIRGEFDDPATLCTICDCECTTCSNRFSTETNTGYHYPVHTWQRTPADA